MYINAKYIIVKQNSNHFENNFSLLIFNNDIDLIYILIIYNIDLYISNNVIKIELSLKNIHNTSKLQNF